METIVETEEDLVTARHRLRTMNKDSWKSEVWLLGSSCPIYYPVNIWVRVFPGKKSSITLPKITVRAKVYQQKDGKMIRAEEFFPQFTACAKMKKHREVSFEDGIWGETTAFPPKEEAWDASIIDPFKSDRRKENTSPLPVGDYRLAVQVCIEGGPVFNFEDINIELTGR